MSKSPFSAGEPKISPARRAPSRPDNTPDDNDRIEIGPTAHAYASWEAAGIDCPDLQAMRRLRVEKLTSALHQRDLAGLLLFDPINIRYATDSTNMQVWNTHNFFRACLLLSDGHLVLFEYAGVDYLSNFNPLVTEIRPSASFYYFAAGDRAREKAGAFAASIDDLLRGHAGRNRRLAVDKIEIAGLRALEAAGIRVVDGEEVIEKTRAIKCPEEVKAMRCAIWACERAIDKMRELARPGVSENEVWAELHRENIRWGGEWIETRLLASGPRTNPWFQECGPRIIQNNEILCFDTDLIGCYGMCVDISRSWHLGCGTPSDEHQRLHAIALEHIERNAEALKPGRTFRELSEDGHALTEAFLPQRYASKYHGVGLCDEWPAIRYDLDHEERGYDGVLEPGMTLCVEAYVGEVGGRVGIKLEEQVLITETGPERLSQYPYDEKLL